MLWPTDASRLRCWQPHWTTPSSGPGNATQHRGQVLSKFKLIITFDANEVNLLWFSEGAGPSPNKLIRSAAALMTTHARLCEAQDTLFLRSSLRFLHASDAAAVHSMPQCV